MARRDSTRQVLLGRLLTHGGDQAWDFAVPLALVGIFPADLSSVAIYYFVGRFLHMTLITRLCARIDRWERLRAIRAGISAQTVGVGLAAAGIYALAFLRPEETPWLRADTTLTFILVMAGGVVSSLGATLTDVALSQDWLPTIVPRERLAVVNSRLKQIDLGTELGAPVLAGLLLSLEGGPLPLVGFGVIAAWNLLSFLPELVLLQQVYRAERALGATPARVSVESKSSLAESLTSGWRDFFAQPAAYAMIAYAWLWLTVLSPHGVLLTAWLKTQWSLPEAAIGVFRGLGAVFGLAATYLFPRVLARLGLVRATRAFIIFQAACLVGAGIAFSAGPDHALPFAALVLLSRIGLYGFSLGETEIRQTTIAPGIRGRVNGFANALTSLSALGVYGAGAMLPSPAQFPLLVYGSIGCVTMGALTFSLWSARRPAAEAERRSAG
jgi:iron-regulated transporter 1